MVPAESHYPQPTKPRQIEGDGQWEADFLRLQIVVDKVYSLVIFAIQTLQLNASGFKRFNSPGGGRDSEIR